MNKEKQKYDQAWPLWEMSVCPSLLEQRLEERMMGDKLRKLHRDNIMKGHVYVVIRSLAFPCNVTKSHQMLFFKEGTVF